MKKFFEAGRFLRSWVYGNEENALFPHYLPYRCECGSSLACARWRSTWYVGETPSTLPWPWRQRVTRKPHRHYSTFRSHPFNWKFRALPSKCDVLSTLPSLQHDFCALWDKIVLEAQNGKDPIPTLILENICPVYIAYSHYTLAPMLPLRHSLPLPRAHTFLRGLYHI
jgi:hypothetical protein